MGQAPVPMVQCRIDTKKLDMGQIKTWTDRDWMEWQANALSSAILMPESMVRLIAESFGNLNLPKRLLCYAMIEKVASVFNVSFEAAGYRLKQLGYISGETKLDADVLNMFSYDLIWNY